MTPRPRPVRHADLDRLARLHARCFPEDAWDAVALAQILAMPRAAGRLVEEDGMEEPIGLIFSVVVADEAEILTLGVDPEWRRHGIGRALIEDLFNRLGDAGVSRVSLEVASDNAGAMRLYEKHGFRIVGQRRGYYRRPHRPPIDAWVLSRSLAG
jgi:ribosomal-protein-alanine N-acetyltransferase